MTTSSVTDATAVPRKRRRRKGLGGSTRSNGVPPIRGLLPIAVLLLAWLLLGSADSFAYPKPSTWFDAVLEIHRDSLLLDALGQTLRTFVLGIVISVIVGVAAGGVIGASRRVDRAFTPVMDFFRALPPPAVISVILLVMGPDYTSALFMVALGTMWPILLNTAAGMRAVPPLRTDMSRTLGLSRFQHIRKVLLPSLVPSALLGLKVAASIAFVITLFIEILGVTDGMGYLLTSRQQRFDSAGTWGLLLVIGICGYLINVAVALIERRLLKGWPSA